MTKDDDARREIPARLTLFGFPARPVRLVATPRSKRKRTTRALLTMGLALVATPLVALVPPHLPWALGAFFGGAFLAWKQWKGAYQVHEFEGACPSCGNELEIPEDSLIDPPQKIDCYSCHHEPRLELTAAAEGNAPRAA